MEQIIQQVLNQNSLTESANSLSEAVIKLFLALILGVVVAVVYKHVHRGISYSASYAYSIVIVTMVVAFIMMVIGTDVARAFTLLGAFTLIRYRTAVKDPKDTAFIFLALVVGLGVGASEFAVSIAGTLLIALTALALDKLNFGSAIKMDQILYMSVDAKKTDQKQLEAVLKHFFRNIQLINVHYDSDNKSLQYSYNIHLGKKNSQAIAMSHISRVPGILQSEILASQQVIEF